MATQETDYWTLTRLGEESQLKHDLNQGVAALSQADESCFHPHVCLNRVEGVKVIEQIARNPQGTNTSFSISEHMICDGGGNMWLNICLCAYLNEMSSNSFVLLTPRQTARIISKLPPESQKIVLEKVKVFYLEYFRARIQEAMDKITKQFETGNPLLADDFFNRIFDIHGEHQDTPYTEWEIAGEELFINLFFGHGMSGNYSPLDSAIIRATSEREGRADRFVGAMRTLAELTRD